MSDWKSIRIAPNDGMTRVLVSWLGEKYPCQPFVTIARYRVPEGRVRRAWCNDEGRPLIKPTHWQPLPRPAWAGRAA